MLKVVTRAGQHESQTALQHRGCQFEGKSRLAADGNAQQSAVAAVRLAIVLNPSVKCGCGRYVPVLSKPGKNSPLLAGSCANAAKTLLGGRPTLTAA
jgi:hypothetical protein